MTKSSVLQSGDELLWVLGDEIPFVVQPELADPTKKLQPVRNGPRIQNGRDVIKMLLRSALPIKEQLVDNDCLRRREPSVAERAFQLSTVGKLPMSNRALSGKVTVGAERAVLVDNIEMPPGLPLDFRKKDLLRRQVEFLDGEGVDDSFDVTRSERDDKIGMQGQSGPTVGDGRKAAYNAIRNPGGLQPPGDEFNLLHIQSRMPSASGPESLLPSNRGAMT